MISHVILFVHIVAGFTALLCGTYIFIAHKGTRSHVFMGKIFTMGMFLVAFSVLWLSIVKQNVFLGTIGIFSLYQTYFGWKSARTKTLPKTCFDFLFSLLGLINGIWMVSENNLVLLVFGGIQLLLFVQMMFSFYQIYSNKEIPAKAWLRMHIGMMCGSFIATFTAFLVVNLSWVEPAWIVWLSPTAVLVPLMQYWTWRFARNLSSILKTKSKLIK